MDNKKNPDWENIWTANRFIVIIILLGSLWPKTLLNIVYTVLINVREYLNVPIWQLHSLRNFMVYLLTLATHKKEGEIM